VNNTCASYSAIPFAPVILSAFFGAKNPEDIHPNHTVVRLSLHHPHFGRELRWK